MAKKRSTPEEIIQHLRTAAIEQGKGTTQEEAPRKIGITPVTLSRRKSEFDGLRVDQASRLKELEQEASRLRKIVIDQTLDILILIQPIAISLFRRLLRNLSKKFLSRNLSDSSKFISSAWIFG
jgi:putative transposase